MRPWLPNLRRSLRPANLLFWFAAALWLLGSWLVIAFPLFYDYSALRCARADRLQAHFEDRLFDHPIRPVRLLGPEGDVLPNDSGQEAVDADVARCLADRVVDGQLRLPAGTTPAEFESAVLSAYDLSQGRGGESDDWYARRYPMNTAAAPCILAAAKRIEREAADTVPERDRRCLPMTLPYVAKWLLLGVGPLVVLVLGVRVVWARMPRR